MLGMEMWDQETFLRRWLGEVEHWSDHATHDDWESFTVADVKTVLWDLLTPERRKFVTVLKPGSKSFVHDRWTSTSVE